MPRKTAWKTTPRSGSPASGEVAKYGVVALIGRANAGKSTLLNAILGEKVSIVSDKPQTTRNRIVGILNETRGQIAFLDTPGIHKPLHRMNVRMMNHVDAAFTEADIIATIIDAAEPFGHGDEFVLEMLRKNHETTAKRYAVLNKIDALKKQYLLPLMERYGATRLFDEIVPISAREGEGVIELVDLFFRDLASGVARYPTEDYTTQPERFFAAEVVREKLLKYTSKELPYTTAVGVDKWEDDDEKGIIRIYASIFVERDSQKKIVIGKGGDMIKRIGTEARHDLEATLGTRVYLDLHVAVHELWREDERFLGELEWPLGE